MQVNSINSTISAVNFQSKNQNSKKTQNQNTTPVKMVKIPYDTLIGLTMLASSTLTSCTKENSLQRLPFPTEPKKEFVITDTISGDYKKGIDTIEFDNTQVPNPVQKRMMNMLHILGLASDPTLPYAQNSELSQINYTSPEGKKFSAKLNNKLSNDSIKVYTGISKDVDGTRNSYQMSVKNLDDGRLETAITKTFQGRAGEHKLYGETEIFRYLDNGSSIVKSKPASDGTEEQIATIKSGEDSSEVLYSTTDGISKISDISLFYKY